ncbi:MAG: class I mannose-6-phosphate isomerase [Candidatus Sumerlaeota bacterium]
MHPDHRACQTEFPDENSKDESWIIVQADPGGTILHGFKPGTNLARFDELLEENKVTECLREVEVDAGQVYRVAPGTVHALCEGVAILEIQEPSDSTFRIYDYGRTDDAGNPRELHLDQARKVMHFASEAPPEVQPRSKSEKWGMHDLLVDVPAYRIERLRIHGEPLRWKVNPRSTQSLIVLDGLLELHGGRERIALSAGQVVVLPAAVGTIELQPQSANATCILAGAGGGKMVDDEK